jgi:hypothetical protein
MKTALEYIMVLPSDKEELEVFMKKIKSEILAYKEPDPVIRKQINICLKLFQELYTDEELEKHFAKINLQE